MGLIYTAPRVYARNRADANPPARAAACTRFTPSPLKGRRVVKRGWGGIDGNVSFLHYVSFLPPPPGFRLRSAGGGEGGKDIDGNDRSGQEAKQEPASTCKGVAP